MKAKGMKENKIAGRKGGAISKKARLELEEKTGKKVITSKNFLQSGDMKKLDKGGTKNS